MMYLLLIVALCLIGVGLTRWLGRRGERLVPALAKSRTVHGLHLHEIGPPDAPRIVLIHGLYGQMQHFTYAMASELAQRYRVILVDRPGCGHSRRAGAMSPADQADLIWAGLDAQGVENPVLVGHSLGGAVAVEMALSSPHKVRGLGLIAPAVEPVVPVGAVLPRLLRGAIAPVLAGLTHSLAAPLVWLFRPIICWRVFAPEPVAPEYSVQGGAALGLRPGPLRAAIEDALTLAETAPHRAERLRQADLPPGEVLFGAADKIVPPAPQIASLTARGLVATLLPGRGHMIPLTDPASCIAMIDRVVDRTHDSDLEPSTETLG